MHKCSFGRFQIGNSNYSKRKGIRRHCNDVILSDAKNLAFSCCYEILSASADPLGRTLSLS